MKRRLMILAMLALLALPVVAGADDEGDPSMTPPGWTPTPPARPMVDLVQLAELLVAKGVITQQDYAQQTRSPVS